MTTLGAYFTLLVGQDFFLPTVDKQADLAGPGIGSYNELEQVLPNDAEIVQAATKWKRMALAQFSMEPGEGLMTDMKAVRKDYVLDHDHSAYVDQ